MKSEWSWKRSTTYFSIFDMLSACGENRDFNLPYSYLNCWESRDALV